MKELAVLKGLTGLHMYHCTRLTDAGGKELAALKNLTSLNLGATQMTDAGVKDLARADTGLKGLVSLSLQHASVTDAGVAAAEARWPGISVVR